MQQKALYLRVMASLNVVAAHMPALIHPDGKDLRPTLIAAGQVLADDEAVAGLLPGRAPHAPQVAQVGALLGERLQLRVPAHPLHVGGARLHLAAQRVVRDEDELALALADARMLEERRVARAHRVVRGQPVAGQALRLGRGVRPRGHFAFGRGG